MGKYLRIWVVAGLLSVAAAPVPAQWGTREPSPASDLAGAAPEELAFLLESSLHRYLAEHRPGVLGELLQGPVYRGTDSLQRALEARPDRDEMVAGFVSWLEQEEPGLAELTGLRIPEAEPVQQTKAPVRSAPTPEPPPAPVKSTPVKSTPVKSTPVKSTPVKSTPVKSTPVEADPPPVEPDPTPSPAPADPSPTPPAPATRPLPGPAPGWRTESSFEVRSEGPPPTSEEDEFTAEETVGGLVLIGLLYWFPYRMGRRSGIAASGAHPAAPAPPPPLPPPLPPVPAVDPVASTSPRPAAGETSPPAEKRGAPTDAVTRVGPGDAPSSGGVATRVAGPGDGTGGAATGAGVTRVASGGGGSGPAGPPAPPREAAPDWLRTLLQGSLGDRYQELSMLGSGGMGMVVRARDTKLRRDVAIKVPPPHLAGQPAFRERFLREAQALAQLSHPNVISIYDVPDMPGGAVPVMIQEYLEGVDLMTCLEREGPPTPGEALAWVREAGEGLAHAHGRGILHRDVKPANLMLVEGRVKVLDFGLASIEDQARLTATGMVMGSLPYMPPEQLRGDRLSEAADEFSLGVTAYQLLTGALPFPLEDRARASFPPASGRARGVPPEVDAVLARALAPDPGARHGSVRGLVDALPVP